MSISYTITSFNKIFLIVILFLQLVIFLSALVLDLQTDGNTTTTRHFFTIYYIRLLFTTPAAKQSGTTLRVSIGFKSSENAQCTPTKYLKM